MKTQFAVKSDDKLRADVNKNFIIRYKFQDDSKTYLVSAGKYHNLVGKETANKHFLGALNSGLDVYTKRIRSHLIIDFVSR